MITSLPKQKNKILFSFLTIWVLASAVGIYVRLYPLFNNTSSMASEQASLLVINNLRQKLSQQIEQRHPNASGLEKQKLLNAEVNKVLHNENTKVREVIDRVARSINENLPREFPFPYLLASDSYYYFDLTQNIVKTGTISRQIQGSKYLNEEMMAPQGFWEPLNLHPYVGYFIYKTMAFFNPKIPLMFAVSFTSLLMTCLCILPFLLICHHWRCPPLVSLTGAIFFVMVPIFVKRSMFAWYDDDAYSIFFPLLVLWTLFNALRHRNQLNMMLRWTAAGCIILSLYAFFWHGWIFLLSVILISFFVLIPANHWVLKQEQETKNLILCFGFIALGTLLTVSLSFGIGEFFVLFQEGWKALNDFINPRLSLWPDLYIAVGELLSAPFLTTVNLAGGGFFIITALTGLIVSVIIAYNSRATNHFPEIVILGTFLFFTTFLAMGAQRFIVLWMIPLCVLFPLGLKYIYEWIEPRLPKKIFLGLSAGAACLMIILRVQSSYLQTPSLLNKIYNDVWDQTFRKINTLTPPDSIISTWWPPGHFIKAMADRRVTFDGATINKPQAYWLANIFLSPDEQKALGLLRMLNNSANQATEYLQGLGIPLSKAVRLLRSITPLNETRAKEKIGSLLTQEQAGHLLSLTHRTPPPSYILIYKELIDNNIQLSFVGNWDFEKAEELNKDPKFLAQLPSKHSPNYASFLWTMAGGQPRFSEELNLQAQSADNLLFDENLKINLNDMLCQINSVKFGTGIPSSIFYLQDDHVVEKALPRANLSYSVIYARRNDTPQCILLDRNVAKSLLMKMYYFEGKGLQYFRQVIKETDLTKRTEIYVYEVDWKKFLKDIESP